MSCPQPHGRPVAIAHRAGNHLPRLERARSAGADFAEFDLWLRRGRLEVRHARTVGPLPLLRERWRLSPGWGPCLELDNVLEAAGTDVRLMVDLKSRSLALSEAVAAAFESRLPGAPYAVTTCDWWLLEPFEGREEVCIMPSAAWPEELAELLPALGERYHTLSLHITLAQPLLLRELADRGVAVYVWPVNTHAELDHVLSAGASGVNSDNLDILAKVIASAAASSEPAPTRGT